MVTTWLLVPVTLYSAAVPLAPQTRLVAVQLMAPAVSMVAVPAPQTMIEPKLRSLCFSSVSGLTIVACAWTGPLLTDTGAAPADVAASAARAAATAMRRRVLLISKSPLVHFPVARSTGHPWRRY